VLGTDMVYHNHTRTMPIMIVLALTAVFASMSVARYVSKQGRRKADRPIAVQCEGGGGTHDARHILDLIAVICLLLGALFSVAAGIGLIRFPDALSRMHAATKPQMVGLIFVLLALALSERSWVTVLTLAPVLLFQMLTAPISAHMIGRAGYRAGNVSEEYLLTRGTSTRPVGASAQADRARTNEESKGD
jgi:multicomponent Na+:H+ antiporter subunit G